MTHFALEKKRLPLHRGPYLQYDPSICAAVLANALLGFAPRATRTRFPRHTFLYQLMIGTIAQRTNQPIDRPTDRPVKLTRHKLTADVLEIFL